MSSHNRGRRTIPAGEFKNRCLALMDEVNETGTEIIITKHGRPVSRLVPAAKSAPRMWGRYRDHVRITGDIVSRRVCGGGLGGRQQPGPGAGS